MKTLKNELFTRLLKKTTLVFRERIVYAYFDNDYYYLEAEKDYTNDEVKINFTDADSNEIELTETQEKELFKLMDEKYLDEIDFYLAENGLTNERDERYDDVKVYRLV